MSVKISSLNTASTIDSGDDINIAGNNPLTFSDWGGGWFMQDGTYIRSLNQKSIWLGDGVLASQGGLSVGYGGVLPTAGYGIIAGSVGIGTATPQNKLHVIGNAWINRPSNKIDNNGSPTEFGSRVEFNNNFATNASGYMVFRYPTSNNFLIGGDYDGNIGGAIPNIQFGRANGTVYLHVDASTSGNVGVGTTTPGLKLDVVGSGGSLSGTAYGNFRATQDQTNFRGVALGYDTSGQIGIIYSESAGTASSLAFWTYTGAAWGERMRITSGGNVYIGHTDDYGARFSVKQPASGNAANFSNGSDADLNIEITATGAATKYAKLTPSVAIPLVLSTTAGSNVGVGLTNPNGKLTVKETDTNWELNTSTDGVQQLAYNRTTSAYKYMEFRGSDFRFSPSDVEKVRINSSGDFLVGTTSSIWGTSNRGIIQLNGTSQALIGLSIGGASKAYLFHQGTNLSVWNEANGKIEFGTNNTLRLTIEAGGNVLIGSTTDAGYKLYVTGKGLFDGVVNSYATMDNLARRINSPEGASYVTSTSSVTGAIKIKLPVARNNSATMMMFTVKLYQYNTGNCHEFQIAGYNYNLGGWYNPSVTDLTDNGSNFNVRFGTDATSDCVWIGETNSGWVYPQVFVTDFQAGYNGQGIEWATGWAISFETSFDTVEQTRLASQVITSRSIGAQSVNYAVSAGTAGALSSMNISQFTNDSGYITSSALSGYALVNHTHDLGRYSLQAPAYIDGLTTTNFRNTLFGNTSNTFNISTARWNTTPTALPGMNSYGTMLAWSGADTQGFIATDYSTANITVGGGNASNINWSALLVHSGNIGSQSVAYATTAGALTSMLISQFTNDSGYVTSGALGDYLPLVGGALTGNLTTNSSISIGTASPVTALDVEGGAYSNTTAKFGAAKPIYLINEDPHIGFNTYYDSGWKYGTGSSSSFAGTLGCATSTGDFTLQTSTAVGNAGNAATLVALMTWKQSGFVGIGTIAPEFKLDVAGGNARINGVMVGKGANSISTNLAVGVQALYSNTTGYENTAIGYYAMYSNTTAIRNTALGNNALYSNTTGASNVAIGAGSLYSNIDGRYNSSVGYNSMQFMRGEYNSALGRDSMRGSLTAANNTGQYNTAVGYESMLVFTSGQRNTSLGYGTGGSLTTGSRNTFVGAGATQSAGGIVTTGNNNTIIGGYGGTTTLSDTVVLADGSGQVQLWATGKNVAFGTTAPTTYANYTTLHIAGQTTTAGGVLRLTTSDSSTAVNIYTNNVGVNYDATTGHSHRFNVSGDTKLIINGDGITTADPGNGAVPWKLGNVQNEAVALVTNQYIEVEINGSYYRLALVEPA